MIPKADFFALLAVTLAAVSGLSITLSEPFVAPEAEPVFTFDNAQEKALFHLIEQEFGSFTHPHLSDSWQQELVGSLRQGRLVYQVQCLHCHGSDGGAETPTARLLTPPPRNFSLGAVRYQSTEPGSPPLRADLMQTVVHGIANTSMSSFARLSAAERNAAVDYVLYLLIRGAVWNQALAMLESTSPEEAFAIAMQTQKARWASAEGMR